ncbi:hypothetical protein R80B4_02540 [Fibrobacteres bacterium R8-0-B4]
MSSATEFSMLFTSMLFITPVFDIPGTMTPVLTSIILRLTRVGESFFMAITYLTPDCTPSFASWSSSTSPLYWVPSSCDMASKNELVRSETAYLPLRTTAFMRSGWVIMSTPLPPPPAG